MSAISTKYQQKTRDNGKRDMVKHELRVESLKARVDSLNGRVKIQKCEFKPTSCEFKSTIFLAGGDALVHLAVPMHKKYSTTFV